MSVFLLLFFVVARMDENTDANQAIFEPPENWRRTPGRPRTTWMKNIHDDLSSLDLGIYEARDLAQNRPLWRLMFLHSNFTLVVVHATNGLDCRSVGVYSWWLVHERRGIDTLQCHH